MNKKVKHKRYVLEVKIRLVVLLYFENSARHIPKTKQNYSCHFLEI